MAIWFSQSLRTGEVHVIDYFEGSGEGFPFYARMLRDKGYVYGDHWAPHDIQVRELGSGLSRMTVAESHGIKFKATPRLRTDKGGEIEEGIHAARMIFSRCWFDEVKCKAGLESLMHYRREPLERMSTQQRQEFKTTPLKDWASHGADAFRGLAVRHKIPQDKKVVRFDRVGGTEFAWG